MHRVARYLNGGPVADMCDLADLLLHDAPNLPTKYDDVPFVGAIVADATPVSYGGVYVDQHGNVQHASGKFEPGQFASVNEAEAWATILTLKLVPARSQWGRLEVFTDNQVWCGALGANWTKAQRIDKLRLELSRELVAKKLVAGNTWVCSEGNPTDGISRQRNWTPEGTVKLRRLLGQQQWPALASSRRSATCTNPP